MPFEYKSKEQMVTRQEKHTDNLSDNKIMKSIIFLIKILFCKIINIENNKILSTPFLEKG